MILYPPQLCVPFMPASDYNVIPNILLVKYQDNHTSTDPIDYLFNGHIHLLK